MTEQITHTPGPWESEIVWSEVFKRFNSARTVRIADCGTTGVSVRECQANARLIAAAPDLLAICKTFLQKQFIDPDGPYIRAMQNAVDKAEGRQPESSDTLWARFEGE